MNSSVRSTGGNDRWDGDKFAEVVGRSCVMDSNFFIKQVVSAPGQSAGRVGEWISEEENGKALKYLSKNRRKN